MKDFFGTNIEVGDIIIWRSESKTSGALEYREVVSIESEVVAKVCKPGFEKQSKRALVGPKTAIIHIKKP